MISIIIPARNEQNFIGKCLESVLAQDYPKNDLEVLVVDGASDDDTARIANDYAREHPFIKVIANEKKITPAGLNLGIRNARGGIIIRMDAHAEYQKDYVSKCAKHLAESGADNVGGAMAAKPAKNTLAAKAIAMALSSPFGAGGAFRLKAQKPMEVDTVFGGCYKKEVFKKAGMFDERLARSQDMEFNSRLRKAGGRIILFPDIVAGYYPKSEFKDFFIHNFWDGAWAIYPLKITGAVFKPRHYAPLLFVAALLALPAAGFFEPRLLFVFYSLLAVYLAGSLFFSIKTAIKEKEWRYLIFMPAAFAARHLGYGLGSIWGLAMLLLK